LAHLLCITTFQGLPEEVVNALTCCCSLFAGVYELLEKRRQALPLISADTADFVDIALEGATN
jgi:hypothetical protein